jgi:hypothetical protein
MGSGDGEIARVNATDSLRKPVATAVLRERYNALAKHVVSLQQAGVGHDLQGVFVMTSILSAPFSAHNEAGFGSMQEQQKWIANDDYPPAKHLPKCIETLTAALLFHHPQSAAKVDEILGVGERVLDGF